MRVRLSPRPPNPEKEAKNDGKRNPLSEMRTADVRIRPGPKRPRGTIRQKNKNEMRNMQPIRETLGSKN